jgi:hypothetical protein
MQTCHIWAVTNSSSGIDSRSREATPCRHDQLRTRIRRQARAALSASKGRVRIVCRTCRRARTDTREERLPGLCEFSGFCFVRASERRTRTNRCRDARAHDGSLDGKDHYVVVAKLLGVNRDAAVWSVQRSRAVIEDESPANPAACGLTFELAEAASTVSPRCPAQQT